MAGRSGNGGDLRLPGVRAAVVVVLLVVGGLLSVLTPATIWTRDLILDTDQYSRTVAPLASNAVIQDSVTTLVTDAITTQLNVPALVRRTLPAASPLAGELALAVDTQIRSTVQRFVSSDLFAQIWGTSHRLVHRELVALLTGKSIVGGTVRVVNDDVTLDLDAAIKAVAGLLASSGLPSAADIPATGALITVAHIAGIERARATVRLLDTLADWLPWLALAVLLAAIAVATRRRRATYWVVGVVAGAMLFLGADLIVGRRLTADRTAAGPARRVVEQTFDQLTGSLRTSIQLVFVVAVAAGLAVALGNFLLRRELTWPAGAEANRRRFGATARRRWTAGAALLRRRRALVTVILAVGAAAAILFIRPISIAGAVLTVAITALLIGAVNLIAVLNPPQPAPAPGLS